MIESKGGTAHTIIQPKREHRPFAYPKWMLERWLDDGGAADNEAV